jgi:hypothetical protein
MTLRLTEKTLDFARGHRYLVMALSGVLLVIAALVVAFLSGAHYLGSRLADARRAEAETKAQKLSEEVQDRKVAAAAALARADEIERTLVAERVEHERIVDALAVLAEQRKLEVSRYVAKRDSLDRIPDYDELRRVNCELRTRLGYPCPESPPVGGTSDRPDGAGARTPPQ